LRPQPILYFPDGQSSEHGSILEGKEIIMTSKNAFTAEEWVTLKTGLLDAGRYLVLADPIGRGDMTKEARAIAGFFADLRDQADRAGLKNELLQALVTDGGTGEQSSDLSIGSLPNLASEEMANLKRATLENMEKAGALLDAKASPDEASEIKIKMYQLAGQTAAAAKEGSFFGIGGVRLTLTEKAALEEVARVLNVNPADAAESPRLPGQEA
jgi:hypothetical protein